MDDPTDRRQVLLTVKEVAARLHLTEETVYGYISDGHLPAANVGRGRSAVYRIRPEALEAFLTARETR